MRGDLAFGPPRLIVEPSAGMHLGILLAVLLLLTAVRLLMVEMPGLLYSDIGPLAGASYTDLHARLPALRVTVVLFASRCPRPLKEMFTVYCGLLRVYSRWSVAAPRSAGITESAVRIGRGARPCC